MREKEKCVKDVERVREDKNEREWLRYKEQRSKSSFYLRKKQFLTSRINSWENLIIMRQNCEWARVGGVEQTVPD